MAASHQLRCERIRGVQLALAKTNKFFTTRYGLFEPKISSLTWLCLLMHTFAAETNVQVYGEACKSRPVVVQHDTIFVTSQVGVPLQLLQPSFLRC